MLKEENFEGYDEDGSYEDDSLMLDDLDAEIYEPQRSVNDDSRFRIGDPELIEMRSSAYKNSSSQGLLATLSLGIDPEAPVLADFDHWGKIVEEGIDYYFHKIYKPNSNDSSVFLPDEFSPGVAIGEAHDLAHGKTPSKTSDLDQYLAGRTGPTVVLIDSIYQNFRGKSWFVKFWMIPEPQNYKKYEKLLEVYR